MKIIAVDEIILSINWIVIDFIHSYGLLDLIELMEEEVEFKNTWFTPIALNRKKYDYFDRAKMDKAMEKYMPDLDEYLNSAIFKSNYDKLKTWMYQNLEFLLIDNSVRLMVLDRFELMIFKLVFGSQYDNRILLLNEVIPILKQGKHDLMIANPHIINYLVGNKIEVNLHIPPSSYGIVNKEELSEESLKVKVSEIKNLFK